jgi:hypothetical protein
MNDAPTESPAVDVAGLKRGEGRWSKRRWLAFILVVFAAQILLLFVFGEKHFDPARTVNNVPHLALADNSGEQIALNDPTLFALPHANDFASAVWLKTPVVPPPSFRWTESPRWLALNAQNLGAVFNQFMDTNRFAEFQLDFKPTPEFGAPNVQPEPAFADKSTFRFEGELARRPLLTATDLPSWPYADVIAPSRVRVLVNAAGDVVSAVMLPAADVEEAAAHYPDADRRALEIARAARFAPASQLTVGLIIFNWRTVPPVPNAPAGGL